MVRPTHLSTVQNKRGIHLTPCGKLLLHPIGLVTDLTANRASEPRRHNLKPQEMDVGFNGRQESNHTVWNIWKERCRRVFGNKALPVARLVMLIQQDVDVYSQAHAVSLG